MSLDQISSLPPAQQEAILNGPALTPPPGVVPNFDNPPNQNAIAYATLAIALVLTTVASIIRFCSRVFVVKTVRLEDFLALVAFGTYVAYIYLNYWLLLTFGFFVHQWDIRVRDVSRILYNIYIGGSLYGVTVGLVKIAILREWSRIFVPWPTRNAFWWTCQFLIGLNASYYIAGLFVGNLACIPREKIWDKTIPGGKCIDNRVSDLIAGSVNLVSDLIILLLPQRVIWKLNLPQKRKLATSLIFTLGVLTVVSAALREYYTVSHWLRDDDTVYAISTVTLWAIAEMTCMFLVLEVPTAPKVFGKNGFTSQIAASLANLSKKESIASLRSVFRRNKVTASNDTQPDSSVGGTPLRTVHTHRVPPLGSREHLYAGEAQPDGSIVHTTQFSTRVDRADGGTMKSPYDYMQQWTQKR